MKAEYFTVCPCQSTISMVLQIASRVLVAQDTLCNVVDTSSNATAAAPSQCACFARLLVAGEDRRTLGAEELAGDVEGLAAHNDNLLSVEQLLSDGAGKATEEVPLAVDDLIHKSARGSRVILLVGRKQHGQRETATANFGDRISCDRKVRTMTGSKVDMVSIPGVVLEVSCRGRSRDVEGQKPGGQLRAKRATWSKRRLSPSSSHEHHIVGV
jgi:hypothetical protein